MEINSDDQLHKKQKPLLTLFLIHFNDVQKIHCLLYSALTPFQMTELVQCPKSFFPENTRTNDNLFKK